MIAEQYGSVLAELPEEYRDRFSDFLAEHPIPFQVLERELQTYLTTVRLVAPMVRLFWVEDAEKVAATLMALLQNTPPTAPSAELRLVQAATRYFMEEAEDQEITGVLGLDDDILVVNAVCRRLGRDELVIPESRQERQ